MATDSKEKVTLAMQFVARREFAEAEKILNDVVASGSELGESHYGMGLIRLGSGQLMDAQALFEKCIKLQPNHANAYYYLGEIAERQQNIESARQFYKEALNINPQHLGAMQKMGLVSNTDRGRVNGHGLQPTNGHALPITNEQVLQPTNAKVQQSDFYALLRRSEEPVEQEISRHLDGIAALIAARNQRFQALISFPRLISVALVAIFGLVAALTLPPLALVVLPILLVASVLGLISLLVKFLRAKTSKITCDRDWLLTSTGIVSKSVQNKHLFILSRGQVGVHQTLLNRFTNDGTLQLTGLDLCGYFRKPELDTLSSHFRQLSLLNPVSRNILAALGELKNIRSGAQ